MRTVSSLESTDGAFDFERETLPHLPDVLRYARSLTRDRGDGDDLVQETYLRAFRSMETYQPGSNARRWLFTICRNIYLHGRQREQRVVILDEPELDALASAGLHVTAQRDGHEDLFAKLDLGPAIVRAMAALPEIHRVVVAMIDIEEMSYAEVAEILGVPIGTIRSRLFRGRRVLQERLIEYARDAGLAPATAGRKGSGNLRQENGT
jgi:RNA polymerase sigma-70 factor (ECF subfamily)